MQYLKKNGKYSNFLDAVFACVASRFIVIRVKLRQHYENKVSFPKTQQNDLGQDLNLATELNLDSKCKALGYHASII